METNETPKAAPEENTAPAEPEKGADVPPKAEHKDAGKGRKKEKADPRIEELEARAEKLQTDLADAKDTYQRMLAEYANYKRRTEQEKEQLGAFTKAEVLKALLPSLDNLERAVDAPAGDEYKTGVDMTIRQFREALASLGLEEIPAKDAPFNPEVHNAVMREDADGVEPDTVTEVFQKGYRIGERVLRPAMVKVAN